MAVKMELVGVRVQMPTNAPILLLRETEGQHRTMPIFIGGPEAHAIDLALSGTETARPMTHDLLLTLLTDLGATVDRIVITELDQGTFFADLHIMDAGGDEQIVSARPSDAIALAVRTSAPIFAEDIVIDEAGIEEEEEGGNEEQMVEELRQFLADVTPDDFKSDDSKPDDSELDED